METMPGVIKRDSWEDRHSCDSDFNPYSHKDMSPHRRDPEMRGSRSAYSNGYASDQLSDSNDDGPTYLLEHLATFSVGAQYGLESPKDGLRKLFQMEKSSGIWTQKMQMRLDRKWIIIVDCENGDVVERFPMNLISDPTAFTSNDPRELYNNILVFIVRDDHHSKNQTPAEMHIFQCVRVSAQEVVDDLKMFIGGKWKGRSKGSSHAIPPPPAMAPPEPPANGINVREQVSIFNAAAAAATTTGDNPSSPSPVHKSHDKVDHIRTTAYLRESNDETSSTTSEKYEREVAILNHCFDDIERFIARLQHAAAAFRELERRRKTRKNKKKDLGDGMLSMRAKPPPEREFVDILQKFKLSFNLLAKLKNHIHDPNSPELVHFLFTPLAVIVDAARDSNYGPNLASRVITPLLTRDALELLSNCCTSKESDLWHSLGDSWIIPREQWKGYESNYHPVFSNGWAPENPFSEERERAEIAAAAAATAAQRARRAQAEAEIREEFHRVPGSHQEHDSRYGSDYLSDRPGTPEHHSMAFENRQYHSKELLDRTGGHSPSEQDFHDHRDRDIRSDFSTDSMEHGSILDPQRQFERQQRMWVEDLKVQGSKIVQVMYPRTANNEKELTVIRGEFLEVLDDSRKWWKTRNARGQVGHVPHTIVTPFHEEGIFSNPLYESQAGRGEHYSPSESPTGRDYPGETTTASSYSNQRGGMQRSSPASADWVRKERQGKKDFEGRASPISNNQNPTPPAPPPQPPTPPPPPAHTAPSKPKSEAPKKKDRAKREESFDEELKLRVTLGPKSHKKWGRATLVPSVYIVPESSPEEVKEWLQTKDFSEKVQHLCRDMTGEHMFNLRKEKLDGVLESNEATRLINHVTVQKNLCGYKPAGGQELDEILQQRRSQVDTAKSSKAKESPKKRPPSPPVRKYSPSPEPDWTDVKNVNNEEIDESSDKTDEVEENADGYSKTLKQILRQQRKKLTEVKLS